MRLRTTNEEVDDDLFSLACGPDFRLRKYSSCIVNGVRFNTVYRDENRRTQNSGVMTKVHIRIVPLIFMESLKRLFV
jgi:hypothetical protein